MNQEKPPVEKVELVDLGATIDERKIQEQQRLEMLREGSRVTFHRHELEYLEEEEGKKEIIVVLREPGTGLVFRIPQSYLSGKEWELIEPIE
jgi:hypothetical protein